MKPKKFQYYYCNNCHKLYCFDHEMRENIVRLGEKAKVSPLICMHCLTIESDYANGIIDHESTIMQEAWRILQMNANKENLK